MPAAAEECQGNKSQRQNHPSLRFGNGSRYTVSEGSETDCQLAVVSQVDITVPVAISRGEKTIGSPGIKVACQFVVVRQVNVSVDIGVAGTVRRRAAVFGSGSGEPGINVLAIERAISSEIIGRTRCADSHRQVSLAEQVVNV